MSIVTKIVLKNNINSDIDTNGTRSITGAELNTILIDMVDSLGLYVSFSFVAADLDAKKEITVTHNLGLRPLHVTLMDNSYGRIPDNNYYLSYPSVNTIKIKFPQTFTGTITGYIS